MGITHYGTGLAELPERTYALKDDWDDNALTGRTNPLKGRFKEQLSGGVGELLKALYRPEWLVNSGSASASSGALQIPAGSTTQQSVLTPSKHAVGAWTWDGKYDNSPGNSAGFELCILVLTTALDGGSRPNDCYFQYRHSNGDHRLFVNNGGTFTKLIDANRSINTSLATHKTTRDEDGNFELFYNGTSDGTATDTTWTTSLYTGFGNSLDVSTTMDNLTVN